jgi:hypothetical protein
VITLRSTSTASPPEVWRVVADAWSYASWVVGAARVDAVVGPWPEPGGSLRYRAGAWPGTLPARAEVVSSVPGAELALHGDLGPAGAVDLVLTLHALPSGSEMAISEDVVAGPGRWIPAAARAAVIKARNRETLRRLALLAERPS